MIPEAAAHNGRMTITEFLEARIAEDEAAAERGGSHNGGGTFANDNYGWLLVQPARVLAECAAKRAIIEEHYWRSAEGARGCGLCNYSRDYGWEETGPCKTVRALAAVYASHPDYRQEWAL